MPDLTNNNIRMRYLYEKGSMKAEGKNFTYADMAEKFDTDSRTVYTWITTKAGLQHLPTNKKKRAKLLEWINDETLVDIK